MQVAPYREIYVQPEGSSAQKTFDNNKQNNFWCYHVGTIKIHVTGWHALVTVSKSNNNTSMHISNLHHKECLLFVCGKVGMFMREWYVYIKRENEREGEREGL